MKGIPMDNFMSELLEEGTELGNNGSLFRGTTEYNTCFNLVQLSLRSFFTENNYVDELLIASTCWSFSPWVICNDKRSLPMSVTLGQLNISTFWPVGCLLSLSDPWSKERRERGERIETWTESQLDLKWKTSSLFREKHYSTISLSLNQEEWKKL